MADALEGVEFLSSLNGCDKYAAIRKGGLQDLDLRHTELGLWVARFLERSSSTLTKLDLRLKFGLAYFISSVTAGARSTLHRYTRSHES